MTTKWEFTDTDLDAKKAALLRHVRREGRKSRKWWGNILIGYAYDGSDSPRQLLAFALLFEILRDYPGGLDALGLGTAPGPRRTLH